MMNVPELGKAGDPMFSRPAHLGDWSDAQTVPWWIAIRARLANQQLQASLLSAVHLVAQIKLTSQDQQSVELGQLTAQIIDDWCETRVPESFPPRPHWSTVLEQLGLLAERYAAGSVLHDAVFDLIHRVLARARELQPLAR